MSQKIKSLLDELDEIVPTKDKHTVVEARAHHFITSGIHLIELIEEQFTPEHADELIRRLFNSLKGRDPAKFQRKMRQIRESKNDSK